MKRNRTLTWFGFLLGLSLVACRAGKCLGAAAQPPTDAASRDEPAARALYERMIETIKSAETLSYESAFRNGSDDGPLGRGSYKVRMKKPNYFHVDARLGDGDRRGVLVGDGQHAWSHWPNGRPSFSGEDREAYEKSRFKVYMKEPAPPGRYSIGHAVVLKKSNWFPVLDPSAFQGVKDSLAPHTDYIREVGSEKVGDEACRVIEVSYLDHGRSHYVWISERDNLPRRLKRVLRSRQVVEDREEWSNVTLNAPMSLEQFVWKPPAGWQQWQPPTLADRLLKPGQPAPDFELQSADGGKVTLSAYRGKIVWLTFWRVQCPPCRDEMPYLERLYRKHRGEGLVVLGFNFVDDRQSGLDFLRENAITFPNVLDSSDEAIKTGFMTYMARAAPVNYLIDRDGKVAFAWLGYDEQDERGLRMLATLGVNVSDPCEPSD
ncbi:MAG: redoxin domain-containing protein [Sedimentisphaerales bacterium]|nr:redoxin domain-containing protein [Sedimentisphaerales bacterium]